MAKKGYAFALIENGGICLYHPKGYIFPTILTDADTPANAHWRTLIQKKQVAGLVQGGHFSFALP